MIPLANAAARLETASPPDRSARSSMAIPPLGRKRRGRVRQGGV